MRRRELIWRLAAAVVVEVGGIGKLGGERRVELEFSKLIWCFFFSENEFGVCLLHCRERDIRRSFYFFPSRG